MRSGAALQGAPKGHSATGLFMSAGLLAFLLGLFGAVIPAAIAFGLGAFGLRRDDPRVLRRLAITFTIAFVAGLAITLLISLPVAGEVEGGTFEAVPVPDGQLVPGVSK